MKLLILCLCLLPTALSTAFGQTSVVITSKDVKDGLTASKMPLKAGDKHRVYAVYASSAPTDAYARGVVIRGADNKQFNVADLAKAKAGTAFALDENKILTAPITIADTNSGAGQVPYTIYIVSTNIVTINNSTLPVSPVFSAQLANGYVDCRSAQLSSASCTVLSAEKGIQLSSFAMGDMNSIDVQVAGFDVATATRYADYTVMSVSRAASADSFVNIPGPIATIHNPSDTPTSHGFVVKRGMAWSGLIAPGASTTFLSNGFHDVGESYAMDYDNNDVVLNRDYDFGADTPVSFVGSVGNYYPDSGDYVSFVCTKEKGSASFYTYDLGELAGQVQSDVCKKISIYVTPGSRTPTGPRFMVQMESGGTNWKV